MTYLIMKDFMKNYKKHKKKEKYIDIIHQLFIENDIPDPERFYEELQKIKNKNNK
jgi:hypothetical protein